MPARFRGRQARLATELLVLVVLAVVVAVGVQRYAAEVFFIPSASMEPQLQVNDRVVVSKLAYDLHAPHRGDIVVFREPATLHDPSVPPGSDLIKRVIALPGETVEGRQGHVLIDGRLLVEPYLPAGTLTSTFGPVRVPQGMVWVMGDNRDDSEDSRVFGPIPERSIVGRAVWRVWPLDRLAFL